ncbi:hypothetical protein [Nonomuraea sp. NPDC049400]|uniref:hypothetical protein n=1 Tax=Nonomuraea sp. NPDC049400 TaxID=3364352 RepID=UPI0037B9C097
MPNLKSVMAGLAISTLLTGGVVGLGATAADAFAGRTILSGDDDDEHVFFNDDDDDDDDDNFAEFLPFFFNQNNGFNNNGHFGDRRCGRGGGGWKTNRRHVCVTVFNDNQNFNFDHKKDKRREFEKDHREFEHKNKYNKD